ncbi:hypothetical protein [Methylobacterium sp. CM6247]
MATQTIHVVQTFLVNELGEFGAEEPKAVKTAEAAREAARKAYEMGKPAIAFSRTGDPSIGEYGSPTVLIQAGEIPEDILEAFCGEGM